MFSVTVRLTLFQFEKVSLYTLGDLAYRGLREKAKTAKKKKKKKLGKNGLILYCMYLTDSRMFQKFTAQKAFQMAIVCLE